MHRNRQNDLVYAPSDLIRFLESPFASWMERLRLESPALAIRDEPSEESKLIAETGNAHEKTFLDSLVTSGRDVFTVPRDHSAADVTHQAMCENQEIIFQGRLELKPFAGYADFLVRSNDGAYEVWDTKLARKVKPYYLIQLCCYAEMLEHMQTRRPEYVSVVLGNSELKRFRTDDYFYYYLQLKSAFLEQMEQFSADAEPPMPQPRADHGLWASHADHWLRERDHLIQVAGITIGQIRKLKDAGIETVEQLTVHGNDRIPRMTTARGKPLQTDWTTQATQRNF